MGLLFRKNIFKDTERGLKGGRFLRDKEKGFLFQIVLFNQRIARDDSGDGKTQGRGVSVPIHIRICHLINDYLFVFGFNFKLPHQFLNTGGGLNPSRAGTGYYQKQVESAKKTAA